ncbi:hypothetical protein CBL_06541 [Carabus blaptoides fortunei]
MVTLIWICAVLGSTSRGDGRGGGVTKATFSIRTGCAAINFKEDNGGRKAHVKFSLLIMTSQTMEELPQAEMWRSLPCFKLSPPAADDGPTPAGFIIVPLLYVLRGLHAYAFTFLP